MIDLRKILASKLFVESSQIQVGYARFLRTAFWLRLLQISVMFNCRFKVQLPSRLKQAWKLAAQQIWKSALQKSGVLRE